MTNPLREENDDAVLPIKDGNRKIWMHLALSSGANGARKNNNNQHREDVTKSVQLWAS